MFTGIIEGVGRIVDLQELPSARRFWIEAPFSLSKEKKGASVAADGCCLTIVDKRGRSFAADVSPETLRCTTLGLLKKGSRVNLELPLRFQDRLGGHIVQGHVDAVVQLISKKKVKTFKEVYFFLKFKFPKFLRRYLVAKGSVTLDGISLTVNAIRSHTFEVCIIPHTQKLTTLTDKTIGDRLNLEVDVLAKYLEQLIKND